VSNETGTDECKILFSDLSDAELESIAVEYRNRAMRLIKSARLPGPLQASHSRDANRLAKLYLQADAELNRRDAARVAAPAVVQPEYDPLPTWLFACVLAGLAVAVGVLLIRSGAV
jgi:hypothetical protein